MIKINTITVYTIHEVATMFSVSSSTVARYIRQGKLHGCRIGRKMFITDDALEAFVMKF